MYPNQYPAPAHDYGRAPMPSPHAGWAAAAVIFFWPLAFSAFSQSSKVVALWVVGDFQGAQNASNRAKRLGKIALLLWAVITVGFIVVYAVILGAIVQDVNDLNSY
ncbi:CD225/dispanin family protein [Aldersonia sp. NBC_00410]|uniref:CD225/dispanin family protein n=1 Tax=Aldersonia sp. NBC_00410 TaxID=2975954 RepID=UPI002259849B|nr:CD225/dispanin family protein [Aldersonia sp. NBC_00410]MCX5044828.1 CD225/dispanin family protein [Aldersonia sp. NBC_00410]MCX5046315.1 CD225/dispanin family protein [Aldersonia sp. NBC_00410]